jgi:hypothetical protein
MSNNDVETGEVVVVEGSIVVPPTHTHDISNGYIKYGEAFSLGLLALVIMGGIVTLITFDIIALTETSPSDIEDLCPSSGLWYYVLVALILILFQGCCMSQDRSYGACSALVPLAMLIWGSIELWTVGCVSELEDTTIYTMSMVHLGISYCGFAICIVIALFAILVGTSAFLTSK